MTEIAPLRGIHYNAEKNNNISELVSPPYDVVTPDEQALYLNSHQNNVMHLILGGQKKEDPNPYAWHERASRDFVKWQAEETLIRDEEPAIYYTELDFRDPHTGQDKTRRGFICLLKLEDFDHKGSVRPHERTFSATNAERLDLMLNVNANLSQIFCVFPDDQGEAVEILQPGLEGEPRYNFTDSENRGHRLWPVTNPDVIQRLVDAFRSKTIYIADGHHRYETSLNYRGKIEQQGLEIRPESPLNYTMVYLCSASDPGLTILPAHRVIKNSLTLSKETFRAALEKYFEVESFSFKKVEDREARKTFMRRLAAEGEDKNALGLFSRLDQSYHLLTLKNGTGPGTALESWPPELRRIDTVVLTGLLLQDVLGISEQGLDDPDKITYTSRAGEAIRQVNSGQAEVACILNPTRMEQVQAAAEAGLIMPRKSTYFYPKVITGLVFNPLIPHEKINRFN